MELAKYSCVLRCQTCTELLVMRKNDGNCNANVQNIENFQNSLPNSFRFISFGKKIIKPDVLKEISQQSLKEQKLAIFQWRVATITFS